MDSWHEIRYLHGTRPFNCKDGTKATEEMMIAVMTREIPSANRLGQGGIWRTLKRCMRSLSGKQYGCKFEAVGRLTECGAAVRKVLSDGIVITRASAGPGTTQVIMQPSRRTE
jgi:hypothetical protein